MLLSPPFLPLKLVLVNLVQHTYAQNKGIRYTKSTSCCQRRNSFPFGIPFYDMIMLITMKLTIMQPADSLSLS